MTDTATLLAAIDKLVVNLTRLNSIVNGNSTTDVTVDGGLVVPSMAKLQASLTTSIGTLTTLYNTVKTEADATQTKANSLDSQINTAATGIAAVLAAVKSEADADHTAIAGFTTSLNNLSNTVAGISTNQAFDELHVTQLQNIIAPFLDTRWLVSWFDPNGYPLGGITPLGRMDPLGGMVNPELPPVLHPKHVFPIYDANGNPAGGIDRFGRFDIDLDVPPFFCDRIYVSGKRQLYAWNETKGEVPISQGEFDDIPYFRQAGNYVYYGGRNGSGVPVSRHCYLNPSSSLLNSVTTLYGFIGLGQSLWAGANTVTLIAANPLNVGKAAMFNGGVRANGYIMDDPNEVIPYANIRDLVDLRERLDDFWGDTRATQAANTFLASAPANVGIICANAAVGAQPYANLAPGTIPYKNCLMLALRMVTVAKLLGKTFVKIYVDWSQGESDGALTQAAYTADLLALQAALSTEIGRITGQALPIILITDQVSSFSDINSVGPVLAQVDAIIANPTLLASTGPKYFLTYSADNLHLDAFSQNLLGAYKGRWMAKDAFGGSTGTMLYVSSASRSGAVVTMNFSGGNGNLVLDTALVTNPGGTQPFGISYDDDTHTATASSFSVSGTTGTLTLSGTPTGANKSVYVARLATTASTAGPVTGARSCVHDSSSQTVTINGITKTLHNYAMQQKIAIT